MTEEIKNKMRGLEAMESKEVDDQVARLHWKHLYSGIHQKETMLECGTHYSS